jgi:hypothetical protein
MAESTRTPPFSALGKAQICARRCRIGCRKAQRVTIAASEVGVLRLRRRPGKQLIAYVGLCRPSQGKPPTAIRPIDLYFSCVESGYKDILLYFTL